MKIELLFPELCNLYGDNQNIRYLSLCLPDAQLIRTPLTAPPAFISQPVDLVYMGPMTEKSQKRVIEKLRLYKEQLQSHIDDGTFFLFTGNAFEVLAETITNHTQNERIDGLGLLPYRVEIDLFKRFNGKVLSDCDGLEIVGFKNQFSHVYGDNTAAPFAVCRRGIGLNPGSQLEGIRLHHFFGTSLLGPLLILNPFFTRHLLGLMGVAEPTLAFEEEIIQAYRERLTEFKNLRTKGFDGKGH